MALKILNRLMSAIKVAPVAPSLPTAETVWVDNSLPAEPAVKVWNPITSAWVTAGNSGSGVSVYNPGSVGTPGSDYPSGLSSSNITTLGLWPALGLLETLKDPSTGRASQILHGTFNTYLRDYLPTASWTPTDLVGTNLTSNTTPTTLVVACNQSSAYQTHYAWQMFDNNHYSLWIIGAAPSVGAPQWFTVQLQTARRVMYYEVAPYAEHQYGKPASWLFQGSNDGVAWTTLDTQSGLNIPEHVSTRFNLAGLSAAYTYFRFYCTAVTYGAGTAYYHGAISDFKIIGPTIEEQDDITIGWSNFRKIPAVTFTDQGTFSGDIYGSDYPTGISVSNVLAGDTTVPASPAGVVTVKHNDLSVFQTLYPIIGRTTYGRKWDITPYPHDDDFTGADGSVPNVNLWSRHNAANSMIIGGKLKLLPTAVASNANSLDSISSLFTVSGDFTVTYRLEGGASSGRCRLDMVPKVNRIPTIALVNANTTGIRFTKSDTSSVSMNTSSSSGGSVTTTDTYFRVVRVGALATFYTSTDNNFWTLRGSYACITTDLSIQIYNQAMNIGYICAPAYLDFITIIGMCIDDSGSLASWSSWLPNGGDLTTKADLSGAAFTGGISAPSYTFPDSSVQTTAAVGVSQSAATSLASGGTMSVLGKSVVHVGEYVSGSAAVPTMTSDTTPSGTASAGAMVNNGFGNPWRIFDKVDNNPSTATP